MEDWKAKQAARDSVAQALRAANPHLVGIGGKVDSLQAAAKNIRIELARAFPGVKFSVKSRRFSMGDAIDVRWVDGPLAPMVDEIIDRYQAGSFDGMEDLYSYSRSAWKEAFGDAKYVHSYRESSDKAIASAIRSVVAKYGDAAAVASVEAYRSNKLWDVFPSGGDWSRANSLQDLIGRVIQGRVWALPKVLPADMAKSEAVAV